MDIYLPVAEMSVNLFVLLLLGGGVGFLSGVFGVGGGFLMTPMLMFIGIPPAVAVGSGTTQILASSVSGVLAHLRRKAVDTRMGLILVVGGFIGSSLGILLFRWLRTLGFIDTVITLSYVFFLGAVGLIMLIESLRALFGRRGAVARQRRRHQHHWGHGLPFQMRFPHSRLYISALTPLLTGASIGILTAIMGVGGGFILIPAMIYLIGMPTSAVVGTSLFQLCFVAALTAFLHAYNNHTVDIVLAMVMIAGGVFGAQIGARLGSRLRGEQLRVLLALIVFGVGLRLAWDLVAPPADPYSLAIG
jgi:uncharacterized protein